MYGRTGKLHEPSDGSSDGNDFKKKTSKLSNYARQIETGILSMASASNEVEMKCSASHLACDAACLTLAVIFERIYLRERDTFQLMKQIF